MRRIGILGGTFDPPHHGHMVMAEYVYNEMELDEIWFIPSHLPPHKQKAAVSSEERRQMVEQAVKGNDHFKVSPVELDRKGKSYTIDTMQELTRANPEVKFYFIIGGDMVESLSQWHNIEKLRKLVQFVGVKRPGYDWNESSPVYHVEIPLLEISSSLIRERASVSKSIRYLVPDNVYHFIKEHRLYESD